MSRLHLYPAACLTKWGAILAVAADPKVTGDRPYRSPQIWVADPNAIDAGMSISDDDIVLLWRVKPEPDPLEEPDDSSFRWYLQNG